MIENMISIAVFCSLVAGSAALYVAPVLIGGFRKVQDIGMIAVINLMLGWTIVGWVVALALALRTVHAAQPAAPVVQNFGSPSTPSAYPSAASWGGPAGQPTRQHPPPLLLSPPPASSHGHAVSGDQQDSSRLPGSQPDAADRG